jgi:hypothetical protein
MGSNYRKPNRENLKDEKSLTRYLSDGMTSSSGPMRTSASLSDGPQYVTNIFDYNTIISETVNSNDLLQIVNQVTSRGIMSNPALKFFSAYSKNGIAGIGVTGGGEMGGTTSGLPSAGGSTDYASVQVILDTYNAGGDPVEDRTMSEEQKTRALVALEAAKAAGFAGNQLVVIGSIAGRESDWAPTAYNGNADTGDKSYGLWQINMINALGPYRRELFGIATDEELFEPEKAAVAAKKLYDINLSKGEFYDWGPYNGLTPLFSKAKDYVSQIYDIALTNRLITNTQTTTSGTSVGSSSPGSAAGGTLVNTIEEIKLAGQILLGHPNCWMKQSGEFVQLLTSGLSDPSGSKYPYASIRDSAGNCFLFPSLLNLLFKIMCAGFVISSYSNSLRNTTKTNGTPSYHNYGGGIDIFGIGKDTQNGNVYPQAPTVNSQRPIYDELFNLMASWGPDAKPREVGAPWEAYYGANGYFKVYIDPNPTHLHLGFAPEQVGQLCPELKGQTATSNNGPI